MNKKIINEPVSITSVYFKGRDYDSYPRRMEYKGITYNFVELGMRYLVKRGECITKLFDVSDGTAKYRLKLDSDASLWTLVAITS